MMQSSMWKRALPTLGLLAALVLFVFAMAVRPAAAAGIIVNSAADTVADDGACTLREAITAANTDTASGVQAGECAAGSGVDDITFTANTTITLAGSQLPAVTTEMSITGNGPANTIIQANAAPNTATYRVFEVRAAGNLTLDGVTARHGRCVGACSLFTNLGGGILNLGTTTVINSTLSGNSADFGGGVYNEGTLTVTNSTLSGNSAGGGGGGGIYNVLGQTIVTNSTLSGNSANGAGADGGGILNDSGTLAVTNSTLSGNTADREGGGILNDRFGTSTVTVTNSTLSGNSAGTSGGGISNLSGTLTVTNSTLSGNMTDTNGNGGGIHNLAGGTATVTGSTLAGNMADRNGGGIYNSGTLTVINSTLSGNSGTRGNGGGIYNFGGTLTVTNSTLSGNTAGDTRGGGIYNSASGTLTLSRSLISGNSSTLSGNEIYYLSGTINANDFNVFGHSGQSDADAFGNFTPGATDITATSDGTDPTALAAILDTTLADNGGPTQTMALLAGSPAIDLAPTASCAAAPVDGVDQRGEPRSIDIPGEGNDGGANLCDAGAFELQSLPAATLTITKATTPAGGTGFPFTIDPTVYNFDFKWGANGGDGSSGTSNGEFDTPSGLALDAAGNVYVADAGNNRVQKFDSSGGYLAQWGGSGSGNGDLTFPNGVAVDAAGDVYVVDAGNSRVQKFDSSGGYLAQWGSSGSGNGEFAAPRGVALDAAGNVYVADAGNNRIQKFDSSGGYLAQWGSSGSGNGDLIFPIGVAVDTAGHVYVADSGNNRVQKFDSSGGYLAQWGSSGSGNGQFSQPTGVAVDAAGNVYVADAGNNRIQKFDSSGGYLAQWGSSGSGNGEFNTPSGLAVDPAGHVYAGDSANNRMQVFTPDLSTILDDGQSDSFDLAPGDYLVSELVPAGWTLDNIDCDGGSPDYGNTTVGLTLADGDDVICTYTNTQPSANACPVDPAFGTVGSELTSLLGTGMGSPTRSKMVAKVVIPNAADVTELYGQMAAKEYSGVRYVRFIFSDKSFQQVPTDGGTFDLGEIAAISWWGDDLTTAFQAQAKPIVKGRWFLQKGMKKMKLPRAIVFYATHDTAEAWANHWSTFGASDNFVAGTPGFDQTNSNILPIPETQATTDVTVQIAVTDVNRDNRSVDVIVTAGNVSETVTLTSPTTKKSELLNIFEVTLEGVPAGVAEVEIELVSVLDEGDSAALLGATAHYACELP